MRLIPTGIELSKSQVHFLTEVLKAQENAAIDVSFGYTTRISARMSYWRRASEKESWASQTVTVTATWKNDRWYRGGVMYHGSFGNREDTLSGCVSEVRSIGRKRETYFQKKARAEKAAAKRKPVEV